MTVLPTRVEIKYCVPELEAANAMRVAELFLPHDASNQTRQRITSLYLDSPALTFLSWQRARRDDRFKLRLRRYGTDGTGAVFAEVKHKCHGRVHKHRAVVAAERVPAFLASTSDPDRASIDLEEPGLVDFSGRQQAYGAVPQVLIRCERAALRGSGLDAALGMTVDRLLQYQPWHVAAFAEHPHAWRDVLLPLDRAVCVLELKHNGRPPQWMSRLMAHLAPWQRSFSKYATAMQMMLADERRGTYAVA